MTEKKQETIIKRPPVLFDQTQIIIQALKKEIEGDLIVYWTSNNSSISSSDVTAFYKIVSQGVESKRLNLFIKSDGGSGISALRIVNLLRTYYDEIIALVPLNCASAATMLSLGADEIHMGATCLPIGY